MKLSPTITPAPILKGDLQTSNPALYQAYQMNRDAGGTTDPATFLMGYPPGGSQAPGKTDWGNVMQGVGNVMTGVGTAMQTGQPYTLPIQLPPVEHVPSQDTGKNLLPVAIGVGGLLVLGYLLFKK